MLKMFGLKFRRFQLDIKHILVKIKSESNLAVFGRSVKVIKPFMDGVTFSAYVR